MKSSINGSLRVLCAGAMLIAARAAWAHDEDEPAAAVDPSIFSGAGKLVLLIAAVVVVGAVWYQLRRRSILNESRRAGREQNRE